MADNSIRVKVIVSDDGTLRLASKSSKRLAGEMTKLGHSVQETDRFWKGASQQSSNSTKNFSKMAQTISGGLVPAYATLAAQVFAVSAAFRFLQSAGDLSVLREGQVAYAAATGVALGSLTKQIIAATDAQVKYSDAAQAAAIGIASGLNPDQLRDLGSAAKDVSLILGRDVTDSFNRLVRGVTKAEPELLDELGVTLRLKDATEKYAASIGKTAQQLTQYERSQAVAVDVLSQVEQKYSRIIEIVDPATNAFNRFGKAFDDVLNQVKELLYTALVPLANFFADQPLTSILLALPVLSGLLKSIIPQFEEFGAKAVANFNATSERLEKIRKQSKIELFDLKLLSGDTQLAKQIIKDLSVKLAGLGDSAAESARGMKALLSGKAIKTSTLDKLIEKAKNRTDEFENTSKKVSKKYVKHLSAMRNATIALDKGTATSLAKMQQRFRYFGTFVQQTALSVVKATQLAIVNSISFISTLVTRVLPLVGVISVAFSLLPDRVQEFLKSLVGIRTITDELQSQIDTLQSLNAEYEKFYAVQTRLIQGTDGIEISATALRDLYISLSSLSASQSVEELTQNLLTLNEEMEYLVDRNSTRFVRAFTAVETSISDTGSSIREWANSLEGVFGAVARGAVDFLSWYYTPLRAAGRWISELVHGESEFIKELKDRNKLMLASLNLLNDNSAAARNYRDELKKVQDVIDAQANNEEYEPLTKQDIKRFNAAKVAFEEMGASLNNFQRLSKDIRQELSTLWTSMSFKTPFDSILSNLRAQYDIIVKIAKDGRKISKKEREDYILAVKRLNIIEGIVEADQERQKLLEQITALEIRSSKGATKLQRDRNKIYAERFKNAIAIEEAEANILNYLNLEALADGVLTQEEKQHLYIMGLKLDTLRAQAEEIDRQIDKAYELGMAFKQGLEDGFSSNLYDIIIGEERSFTDAILKTGETALKAMAKALSDQVTESLFSIFDWETEDQKRLREQTDAVKEGFIQGASIIEEEVKSTIKAVLGEDFIDALEIDKQFRIDPRLPVLEPQSIPEEKKEIEKIGKESSSLSEDLGKFFKENFSWVEERFRDLIAPLVFIRDLIGSFTNPYLKSIKEAAESLVDKFVETPVKQIRDYGKKLQEQSTQAELETARQLRSSFRYLKETIDWMKDILKDGLSETADSVERLTGRLAELEQGVINATQIFNGIEEPPSSVFQKKRIDEGASKKIEEEEQRIKKERIKKLIEEDRRASEEYRRQRKEQRQKEKQLFQDFSKEMSSSFSEKIHSFNTEMQQSRSDGMQPRIEIPIGGEREGYIKGQNPAIDKMLEEQKKAQEASKNSQTSIDFTPIPEGMKVLHSTVGFGGSLETILNAFEERFGFSLQDFLTNLGRTELKTVDKLEAQEVVAEVSIVNTAELEDSVQRNVRVIEESSSSLQTAFNTVGASVSTATQAVMAGLQSLSDYIMQAQVFAAQKLQLQEPPIIERPEPVQIENEGRALEELKKQQEEIRRRMQEPPPSQMPEEKNRALQENTRTILQVMGGGGDFELILVNFTNEFSSVLRNFVATLSDMDFSNAKLTKLLGKPREDENEGLINTNTELADAVGDASTTIEETMGKGGAFEDILGFFSTDFGRILGRFGSSLFDMLGGSSGGLTGIVTSAITSLFAMGGVANGGFQAFERGSSIIREPTLGLVGEGRYNEAIVPLPSGDSIPVDLGGLGMGAPINNTNVTVNISGSQVETTTEGQTQQGRELGRLVSFAVQKELQKQTRPGGILSPYGAAR